MTCLPAECNVEDCTKQVKSRGLCSKHWKRWHKHGDVDYVGYRGKRRIHEFCTIEDCLKPHHSGGYCQMHHRRWAIYGDPQVVSRNPAKYKGAKYKVVMAPDHPNAKADGSILEHRLVMSQILGRPLYPNENVHHKNGDGFDNRPENLEIWNTAQPAGQRPADKVEYAIMILEMYAPELLADEGRS